MNRVRRATTIRRILAERRGQDFSGATKNRSYTKKGPGRMPFNRRK